MQNDEESKALESDSEYVDKVSDSDSRTKLVKDKYKELKKELEEDKDIEADYGKKLELRCEGIRRPTNFFRLNSALPVLRKPIIVYGNRRLKTLVFLITTNLNSRLLLL